MLRNSVCFAVSLSMVLLAGGYTAQAADSKDAPTPTSPLVAKTPAGAIFPVCWDFKIDEPKTITVGSNFDIKISITPLLFDMANLEMMPDVGGALKLISGPGWKGSLKLGETQTLTLTVQAQTNGFNGPYGVSVKAPKFYEEVKKYVLAQKDGPYATPDAKQEILEQLDGMKEGQPVCTEWVGSTIEIKQEGGK